MRIALCFAGQPRSFEKGYEYYARNLLNNNDVDVFIHTWEGDGVDELLKLYKPKRYCIDKPIANICDFDGKFTNTPNAEKWPPRFTVSAFYSMFMSCFLKINQEMIDRQYDWVVKSRTDYAMNGIIPFDQLDETRLYIPNCRMVETRDFGNDQFAFGSSDVMNQYMQTYMHLDTYYNAGVEMIGEDMMSANLKRFGLVGEKLVYVDMNNPFPPGPHNGTPHSLIRDDYEKWTQ